MRHQWRAPLATRHHPLHNANKRAYAMLDQPWPRCVGRGRGFVGHVAQTATHIEEAVTLGAVSVRMTEHRSARCRHLVWKSYRALDPVPWYRPTLDFGRSLRLLFFRRVRADRYRNRDAVGDRQDLRGWSGYAESTLSANSGASTEPGWISKRGKSRRHLTGRQACKP